MREFTDQHGARWVVYEVDASATAEASRRYLPGDYKTGWLVFETETRKLRLAPVPDGWHDITDTALRRLLLTATPTTPTTPRGQRAFGAPAASEEAARRRD